MTVFLSRGITKKLTEFEGNANNMQHFVINYTKQFEMILLFVRSTIQQDLQLHMESLESLTKYVFVHDPQNYARLLPLYITTMQTSRPLGRIHERKLLCDERCFWVHFNSSRSRDLARKPNTQGDWRNSRNNP